MNTRKTFLYLSCVFTFLPSLCFGQAKDDGLLATPYPGSVAETFPGTTDPAWKTTMDARSRTYYSKDPMEKVKTHYTKLLGPFEEHWKDYIYNKEVVPAKDVYDIVTKRGGKIGEGGENFYGGTFAGVTISVPPTNGVTNASATNTLGALQQAYLLRFQETENTDPVAVQQHLEDPELKQVLSRYEYLTTAYFIETKEKRKDNMPGTLAMDEVIYDKYFTAPAEARAKEAADIQKKYGDAMTKMQYDAATKLSDRIVELSGMQPDHQQEWNTAMKCLEELAKNAYLTKIVIDMHPSKWDITPPEN